MGAMAVGTLGATIITATEGRTDIGAACGWVYFGFLIGVAPTGPLAGTAGDYLGSYTVPLTVMVCVIIAAATAAAFAGRVSERIPEQSSPWIPSGP